MNGTCNESTWRDKLISLLKIDYFNPVVDDWTEECMIEERRQRVICDYVLYVITPLMTGVYSIAEVVDDNRYEKGHHIITSSIISVLNNKIMTKSGTEYIIEKFFNKDDLDRYYLHYQDYEEKTKKFFHKRENLPSSFRYHSVAVRIFATDFYEINAFPV